MFYKKKKYCLVYLTYNATFVLFRIIRTAEVYSESSRTSTMELFAKIVKSFQLLTIFIKSSIFDIRLGFEYASE